MTVFGDHDPEDAYDAGDPVNVRLDVLQRVVDALRFSNDRREARRQDALRVVNALELVEMTAADRRRQRRIRLDLEQL